MWGSLVEDDKGALPAPPDRNGRHWVRVAQPLALSSVLLKYAYKITCQFSSRLQGFECDPFIYLRLVVSCAEWRWE